ncbi:hypothetical protein OUZ56_011672 [Daphnia magna]|uniref:Uncharacterized protein n=1 Tax=Daphnia magna TaxID=35525 RepID=A0ABQ9Z0V8_9CRUS|nr:hypothetical protein OUZ56_011672 [Daphnia magna]
MTVFRLTEVSMTPSLIIDLVPSFTPIRTACELVAHSFIFIAHANLIASASWVWYKTHHFLDVRNPNNKCWRNKRFVPRLTVRTVSSYASPLPTTSPTRASRTDVAALTVTSKASTCHQLQHRRETQFAQQKNVLRNHAQSLFKDSDTEDERRELLRQASTLLHEADPSLTPSKQKRTSFQSQYSHSRIHDIPEDELIFELQHHLEVNGRIRLSDEHTRVSLLSLLALYPSLDTPARHFEFLNLRTGYTPVLPRSYDSSDSAPSIDAPTPPLRTDTVKSTEERLIDVPTPDFARPDPNLPDQTEFSPVMTSDPDTIEETPGKPTPRQETDKFTPPTSTSSPIASPTMSYHHTLHPTPMSGPPVPYGDEDTVKQEGVIYASAHRDRQRSGRFDDWAAHLESALDVGNFEKARKLRLMRSKLYGEAAEEFDTFKLDNPIRSQEYAAVKARLFKLFHSIETRSQRSVEFHNMKRESVENMRRYANRIRKAFHKAYPMDGILESATAASREQMMMDRFLEGLPSDVQVPLKYKKFASFETLIDRAELTALDIKESQTRVRIHAAYSSTNAQTHQNELTSVLEALNRLSTKVDQNATTHKAKLQQSLAEMKRQ